MAGVLGFSTVNSKWRFFISDGSCSFLPIFTPSGKQKDKAKTSFLVVSSLYCLYLTLGNSPPYDGVIRWFSMEWFGYASVHLILHFGLFWVFFPFRILQDIFGKQALKHLFLRLVWISALPWSYFSVLKTVWAAYNMKKNLQAKSRIKRVYHIFYKY